MEIRAKYDSSLWNSEHATYEECDQKLYATAYNNGIESDVEFDKKMGDMFLPNDLNRFVMI
jgi:hypothetical protein